MANSDLVVLLDVDNTLLDNDLIRNRLGEALAGVLGAEHGDRFWEIYEAVREELDFVNFPETVERFGRECADTECVSRVGAVLYEFPFRDVVYPESLAAVRHIASFARPVILSDGDQLFQRYKIRVAGLEEAVRGNVLVYVHKEQEIPDIQRRFPTSHYVMVDDKPRIHAAMKPILVRGSPPSWSARESMRTTHHITSSPRRTSRSRASEACCSSIAKDSSPRRRLGNVGQPTRVPDHRAC